MSVAVSRCLLALLVVVIAAPTQAIAQTTYPIGEHRLALITPGGDLPFGLSLEEEEGGGLRALVINGEERIQVAAARQDQVLVLSFPHYDSEVRLQVDIEQASMRGEWTKRRGQGKVTRLRVESRTQGPRFAITPATTRRCEWPNGRYRVKFAESTDPAVGVFTVNEDPRSNCAGTFLTTLGDYRYLAGNSDGETFKLSCFDGAHAFLFHGRLRADASIEGDFWSSDSWHERWTGAPDKDAALADGWGLTKWRADADLSLGKYRDLNGQRHAITDPPFAGKVRVLEVFGSWCPNCHDHGEYMAELSRRYRGKNLQVIGLAFEHDDNFARCARQVEAFAKRHNAEFPILIAGLSNKSRASESLRLVDRIRSFPTTIFIDKHDQVRGIYQGWSGPATGDAHKRLRQRFESLIDSLLGED